MRNIPADGMKGLEIARNTVIFGVNGSGKTTVTSLLARLNPETVKTKDQSKEIGGIAVFNSHWIEERIGPLVRGGTGPGIARTVLGKENVETKKRLDDLLAKEEQIAREAQKLAESVSDAEKKQVECIDKVKEAIAKDSRNREVKLTASTFNKTRIQAWLDDTDKERHALSDTELRERYKLLKMEDVRVDAFEWQHLDVNLSSRVEHEIETGIGQLSEGLTEIDPWVREGLNRHHPGDDCDFCGNLVSETRLNDLRKMLEAIDASLSEDFLDASKCVSKSYEVSLNSLERLDQLVMEDPISKEEWEARKNETQLALKKIVEYLGDLSVQFANRAARPASTYVIDLPDSPDFKQINHILSEFEEYNNEIRRSASLISARKDQALIELKNHFLSGQAQRYPGIKKELDHFKLDHTAKNQELSVVRARVNELESELSSSAPVAQALTESLFAVLGDDSLKVQADPDGQYTIRRHGSPANFMSEGEKKMLALMYFLETLGAEDVNLSNWIVVLDDLGAELDESRMIYMDDLIVRSFERKGKFRPASIVYTTHSFHYFRHLVDRIYERNKTERSRFYEAYKTFSSDQARLKPTRLRRWEDRALAFPTEYLLTFNAIVIEALQMLESEEDPSYSHEISLFAGNHCRKVLETFTEFKHPHDPKFGVRIDAMRREILGDGFGALSKLANSPSHSGLSKESSYWSRETISRLILDTLRFVQIVDPGHFEKMVVRVTDGYEMATAGPEGLDSPLDALSYLLLSRSS